MSTYSARDIYGQDLQPEQEWRITSDRDAEWLIERVAEDLAEIARYKQSLQDKIADLKAKLDQATAEEQNLIERRNGHLANYFDTIDPTLKRKTKTQEQYRLPSGKIIKKYPSPEFVRTDDQLLAWIKANNRLDLVEISERPKWAELKKQVAIAGGQAIWTETGEVVAGVKVVDRPPVLEFKEG